jgi:hypothetical protein
MPADMSSPRQGERSLKLLDDMNNWGLRKRLLAEVDVFQIDSTHELYAHMNVNYVRAPALPSFDNYGQLLRAMDAGDFFVSTGEVLLPNHAIRETSPNRLRATARVKGTLPLQFAELIWGDGAATHRMELSLESTGLFADREIALEADAPNWKWARLAVWDVAGNGAFVNPVWKEPTAPRP